LGFAEVRGHRWRVVWIVAEVIIAGKLIDGDRKGSGAAKSVLANILCLSSHTRYSQFSTVMAQAQISVKKQQGKGHSTKSANALTWCTRATTAVHQLQEQPTTASSENRRHRAGYRRTQVCTMIDGDSLCIIAKPPISSQCCSCRKHTTYNFEKACIRHTRPSSPRSQMLSNDQWRVGRENCEGHQAGAADKLRGAEERFRGIGQAV